MRIFFAVILSLSLLFIQSGCVTTNARDSWGPIRIDAFIDKTYSAVDRLLENIESTQNKGIKDAPIIVATLVNIDELNQTSRLGRSVSEMVSSRLTQKGYKVIELKLRGNIFVQERQGEMLLSRELKDISQSHRAQAVVVGTYSPAMNFIHVNLKLVSGDTQLALGAADFGLPIDDNTRALLQQK